MHRLVCLCLFVFLAGNVSAGDPDTNRNATELILSRGYSVETYYPRTDDGFYLEMLRLPNPGKPAVLLQHGLMDTAATWVINSPTTSLGYMLHDAGYDVFLCNSRGNMYSQISDYYEPFQPQFWAFDFDTHASLDVPACINGAKEVSGRQKVAYIGHSQGATIGFASLTTTGVASNVSVFVALAPVTYLKHQGSTLFGFLSTLHVDALLGKLPPGEFVPTPALLSSFLGIQCVITPSLCNDLISSLFGDAGNLDPSRMGVFTAHWPDMTSRQNMIHWIQSCRDGGFPTFGGRSHYDPSKITVPTAIYYGTNDFLGDPLDEDALISAVSNSGKLIDSQEFGFAHMDFVWAESAASLVYPSVMTVLSKFSV